MAICSEIDATILNKQSRTADKGWSTSLGVGRGATNPLRKKKNLPRYEPFTIASDLD